MAKDAAHKNQRLNPAPSFRFEIDILRPTGDFYFTGNFTDKLNCGGLTQCRIALAQGFYGDIAETKLAKQE